MFAEWTCFIPIPSEFFKPHLSSLSGASDQLWPLEGSRGTKAPRRGMLEVPQKRHGIQSAGLSGLGKKTKNKKQEIGNSGNTYIRKFSLLIWKSNDLGVLYFTWQLYQVPLHMNLTLKKWLWSFSGTCWKEFNGEGVWWAYRKQPWVLITQGINWRVSLADVRVCPAGENCHGTCSDQGHRSLLSPFLQETWLPVQPMQQMVRLKENGRHLCMWARIGQPLCNSTQWQLYLVFTLLLDLSIFQLAWQPSLLFQNLPFSAYFSYDTSFPQGSFTF